MKLTRLVPLYVGLLLFLSALGALNQTRFDYQNELIDRKAELYERIAELRGEASLVRGPLAVGAWARAQGMVAAPEVANVRVVASLPAPEKMTAPTGLEVRTVWQ